MARFWIHHLYNWMLTNVKLTKNDISDISRFISIDDIIKTINTKVENRIIRKQLISYINNVA